MQIEKTKQKKKKKKKRKNENRTANSVDSDEMAHYDPSPLDLHCFQRYLLWSAGLKG